MTWSSKSSLCLVIALALLAAVGDASAQTHPAEVPGPPPYAPAPPSYVQPHLSQLAAEFAAQAPYRFETRERPVKALWIPGMSLLLATWFVNFLIATPLGVLLDFDATAVEREESWGWSFLPVAGPWVQLALDTPVDGIPITFGILQAAGLVMLVLGLVLTEEVQVPVLAEFEEPRLWAEFAPQPGGGVFALSGRL